MEALTAASVAALTIYDMCKAVDRGIEITAIRLVHKPTGIMILASTHRDQGQNKRQAMSILQAKREQLAEEKRQAEIAEASGGKLEHRGWGAQIRSYVLHPYQMVKDLRTEVETGLLGIRQRDLRRGRRGHRRVGR